MAKYAKLIMVDGTNNHNKYYEMKQINDMQFQSNWGRYGSTPMTKLYSMAVWDKIYQQKLQKGYADVTGLKVVSSSSDSEYDTIEDTAVKELVDKLLSYAKECVKRNYQVGVKDVTKIMITTAQASIDALSDICDEELDISEFNKELIRLFTIIPRQMKNVAEFMANNSSEYVGIIDREQKLLDVMASLVDSDDEKLDISKKRKTILNAFGLDIRPCTDEENNNIKRKLTEETVDLYSHAFRIEQKDLEKRYREYVKDNHISRQHEHFYYHGTKNQNVWAILKTGLQLNPNAPITGKMFGYGIYFAPRAKKSIGYTSLQGSYWARGTSNEGYLLVMKVAYKNPLDVYTHEVRYMDFRKRDIQRTGNDALFAHKGQMLINDEVVIYDEAQVNPRYLIVLKSKAC